MKTYSYEGTMSNDIAHWRRADHSPYLYMVCLHGIHGWMGADLSWGVPDDYGNLVRVKP